MIGTETLRTVQDNAMRMTGEMLGMGRNIWLAGLGTVATVEGEVSGVFERLVEKGKTYETPSLGVNLSVSDAKETVVDLGKKVEDTVTDTMAMALHRFGVPTRDEIHSLIERVESLTSKVESLAKK